MKILNTRDDLDHEQGHRETANETHGSCKERKCGCAGGRRGRYFEKQGSHARALTLASASINAGEKLLHDQGPLSRHAEHAEPSRDDTNDKEREGPHDKPSGANSVVRLNKRVRQSERSNGVCDPQNCHKASLPKLPLFLVTANNGPVVGVETSRQDPLVSVVAKTLVRKRSKTRPRFHCRYPPTLGCILAKRSANPIRIQGGHG